MARKNKFKRVYLCYIAALTAVMIICLIYVGTVLKEYEDSQPERLVEEQMDKLTTAAKNGTLTSEMELGVLSEEEKSALTEKLAEGSLSYKLTKNEEGGEQLVYTLISGDERLADISISGTAGKTKLILFTMTEWSITKITPAVYEYDLILPRSISVYISGEKAEGEDAGGKVRYSVHALSRPDVTIVDALGNSAVYDGQTKLSVTEYVIQIPSNFTIVSASGEAVPLSFADTAPIDDYKYVSHYTEMPESAVYKLDLLPENPQIIIKDNLGNDAPYEIDGHKIILTEQSSLPDIPEGIYSAEEVLSHARAWSLFMTADLGGANYGYGKIEKFLLPDSYLREVAYGWATGVDITFTSVHTLDNPPFTGESVSGYIKYSDECFSCDVKLSKVMHLNSGDSVTDSMNSRFYYIMRDGAWYVADIQEIIG